MTADTQTPFEFCGEFRRAARRLTIFTCLLSRRMGAHALTAPLLYEDTPVPPEVTATLPGEFQMS